MPMPSLPTTKYTHVPGFGDKIAFFKESQETDRQGFGTAIVIKVIDPERGVIELIAKRDGQQYTATWSGSSMLRPAMSWDFVP